MLGRSRKTSERIKRRSVPEQAGNSVRAAGGRERRSGLRPQRVYAGRTGTCSCSTCWLTPSSTCFQFGFQVGLRIPQVTKEVPDGPGAYHFAPPRNESWKWRSRSPRRIYGTALPIPPPPPNGHGSDKYPPCTCGPAVGLV